MNNLAEEVIIATLNLLILILYYIKPTPIFPQCYAKNVTIDHLFICLEYSSL